MARQASPVRFRLVRARLPTDNEAPAGGCAAVYDTQLERLALFSWRGVEQARSACARRNADQDPGDLCWSTFTEGELTYVD